MLRLLLISLFLFAASPAWAATYYVAKTGNNSNSCATAQDITTPKLTVNAGIACLTAAGDTLYIRTGTYVEAIGYTTLPVTGTAVARITIARYQSEVVTLAPTAGVAGQGGCYVIFWGDTRNYFTIDGINLNGIGLTGCVLAAGGGAFSMNEPGPTGMIIKNLDIANGPGANVMSGVGMLIDNVTVHGSGWKEKTTRGLGSTGLYMEGISNSVLRRITSYDNSCDGIRIGNSHTDGSNPANNNVLEYSITHTNGNGKGLGGTANVCSSTGGGMVIDNSNNIIRHNLVYNNAFRGIWVIAQFTGQTVNNNQLYNNTVTSSANGIVIAGSAADGGATKPTNTLLTNNHVIGNASQQIADAGTGTISTTNRTTGSLTDCTVSTSDFTHKAGSSCIGAGTAISGMAYNGSLPDIGWSESLAFSSATINGAALDVSFGMNLNTPVAGITAAQFTAACSGNNCGTPVVSTAAILPSSDSVVRLTLTGLNGGGIGTNVCEAGQTWTVTGTRTAATDSALLGSAVAGTGVNQPIVAFATQAVTNGCGAGVTGPTFTQLASSTFTRADETPLAEVSGGTAVWTSTNGSTGLKLVSNAATPNLNNADSSARYTGTIFASDQYSRADLTTVGTNGGGAGMALIVRGNAAGTSQYRFAIDHHASATTNAELSRTVSGVTTALTGCTPSGNPWDQTFTNADTFTLAVAGETVYVYDKTTTLVKQCVDTGGGVPTPGYPGLAHSSDTSAGTLADNWSGGNFAFSAPPPAVGTFLQAGGQFSSAVTPFTSLGAVNAANTNVRRGTAFSLVLQTDCTTSDCVAIGERVYYSRNGGTYAQVPNREGVGTDGISFYGATNDPSYISGAVTCCLIGALTANSGTTLYTADAIPVFDLAQDASIVQRFVLLLQPTAVLNDTYEFKVKNQTSELFSSYTPANGAKLTVTPAATISAPASLTAVGASSNTIIEMVWAPVTDTAFIGYRVYQCSVTPCTIAAGALVQTITPASAAATHTSPTLFRTVVAAAGTYYFVVTAFDSGGQESVVSNEIAIVRTGFTSPAVRVP